MNKEQELWLNEFVESGDGVSAVKLAYPNVKESGRSAKAGYLKSCLIDEIDKATRARYLRDAPTMVNVIKELALTCEQPAIKLKAADTWLSRAGHDAAQVLEVKEVATHAQLIERFKIASAGISPDLLKDVIPSELLKELNNEQTH